MCKLPCLCRTCLLPASTPYSVPTHGAHRSKVLPQGGSLAPCGPSTPADALTVAPSSGAGALSVVPSSDCPSRQPPLFPIVAEQPTCGANSSQPLSCPKSPCPSCFWIASDCIQDPSRFAHREADALNTPIATSSTPKSPLCSRTTYAGARYTSESEATDDATMAPLNDQTGSPSVARQPWLTKTLFRPGHEPCRLSRPKRRRLARNLHGCSSRGSLRCR